MKNITDEEAQYLEAAVLTNYLMNSKKSQQNIGIFYTST